MLRAAVELGPHGEWRRALPHHEAAHVLLRLRSVTTGGL